MKIVHIGMAAHYTEGMTYQDQILCDINCKDGHDVTYISDTSAYVNGKLINVGECDEILKNGLRLIRLKYDYCINHIISDKLQKATRIEALLEEIEPDTILYHGIGGYSLLYASRYKKKHPNIKLYADCHASFGNSSRTILSKIFNKYVHGLIIKQSLSSINKILYVAEESKDYLKAMYKIPDSMLEWFPLGGLISSDQEIVKSRNKLVESLKISEDSLIIAHSGKLVPDKKTDMLLSAVEKLSSLKIVLIIFGSIPEGSDLLERIDKLPNVFFLGWKEGREITELYEASDIYCQPGTVSVALQNSLCSGCAVISYPWPCYTAYPTECISFCSSDIEIKEAIEKMLDSRVLEKRKNDSLKFAKEYLDYKKIAARLYI